MSQTLAQRRVLAEHTRQREPSPRASDTAPDASARPGPTRSTGDATAALSGPAGRAVLTLVRSGARVVEVAPGRVRLSRDGAECEVDPRGRVAWRAR